MTADAQQQTPGLPQGSEGHLAGGICIEPAGWTGMSRYGVPHRPGVYRIMWVASPYGVWLTGNPHAS